MPSLFSRDMPCPGRCPRGLCCRRPRRRLLPPPPPEGLPGPAFIVLSDCETASIDTEFQTPRMGAVFAQDMPAHPFATAHYGLATGHTVERTPPQNRTAICE